MPLGPQPSPDILDSLVNQHFLGSKFTCKIFDELGIVTMRDLLAFDMELIRNKKGIGQAKIDKLTKLIAKFRELSITEFRKSASFSNIKKTDHQSDCSANLLQPNVSLTYVPSILKIAFKQSGIDSVEKLLKWDYIQNASLSGWGQRKTEVAEGLRMLYLRLYNLDGIKIETPLKFLVPALVLPEKFLAKLSIQDFLNLKIKKELRGKAVQESSDLRALLRSFFWNDLIKDSIYGIEWRDVPLKVGHKIECILDKYQISTIKAVIQFSETGYLIDPVSGCNVNMLQENNFGESSLRVLREELEHLRDLGVQNYQNQYICSIEKIDCQDLDWQEVPLKIGKRTQDFLKSQGQLNIRDVHRIALRSQIFCHTTQRWVPLTASLEYTSGCIKDLLQELGKLAECGLDNYRFGLGGVPGTLREAVLLALNSLEARQIEIIKFRCEGGTLDEIAEKFSISKERCRQIIKSSYTRLISFRSKIKEIFKKDISQLPQKLFYPVDELSGYLLLDAKWQAFFLVELIEYSWEKIDAKTVSQIPSKCVLELEAILKTLSKARCALSLPKLQIIGDVIASTVTPTSQNAISISDELKEYAEIPITSQDFRILLGDSWLRASVRSQIVESGINGIGFEEINTEGLILHADDLERFVGNEAVRLPSDRFRRRGEIYDRADEILNIVREAQSFVDVDYIISKSARKWHQAVLTGVYLTRLHEVLNTGRGSYIHISKLGLTVSEVKEVMVWGVELLKGKDQVFDGCELFDLFKLSLFTQKIENAYQLVSIIAKHPDIRRISSNLQLAHRKSFDDSALSLAKKDPEIAAQWHPIKNGLVTPFDVRAASFKSRWWKCSNGHEFEAMPVYRTRMIRGCPGCQERWTIVKLRHFIASLRDHLEAFTPAELFLIFQQSGVLNRGGRAKGFVKSLATGRFPVEELDKFVKGDESLVDLFILDQDVDLESIDCSGDNEESEVFNSNYETIFGNDKDLTAFELPTVTAKAAISALDCPVIACTDSEAVDFLVASAKAKIWSHAFRSEHAAVREVEEFGFSDYALRVREEFFIEYRAAAALKIPKEYAFMIGEDVVYPNLMQRHVAVEIHKRKRFGNWSGPGAGKTLSAVLASRVCECPLTIVWCPNSVVGDFTSGWSGEILRIFPDSDVCVKTWNPVWAHQSKYRYLIMNYEQLQQPESENFLNQFLSQNFIDFIVIDEVHFAKQRFVDQLSKRKRLLQMMVSKAGEKNDSLRVLGLSATPVINNLQEGRSLIEMISGVEQHDLPVKPTVPNCMRLHQQLARLGTRWRPEYKPSLIIETPEVNCEAQMNEIRALGHNPSPLDIERILTKARLPSIIEALKQKCPTLIYTHYVEMIVSELYDSISAAGFRVGLYTGESKEGLKQFKNGSIDVLIASSTVGTGVDGLQFVCDQLVINCLPWTNAEYEQLIGRIWRQGQSSEKVNVIIPLTYAKINGVKWSYCQSKLQRIKYKKSIADAAIDGVVPEGNLRNPTQAQKDILAWLQRLDSKESLSI